MPGLLIPSDFPLEDLVAQEVLQVCIGIGQVQLHFHRQVGAQPKKWEPGARIDLEAGFALGSASQITTTVEQANFKAQAGTLTCLLG